MKLQEIDILPSTYNPYDSDFFYIVDLGSGHFRDFPIIRQWGKGQVPQILIISVQIVHNHTILGIVDGPGAILR